MRFLTSGFVGGPVDAVISFVTDLLEAAHAIAPIIADRVGTTIELHNTRTF